MKICMLSRLVERKPKWLDFCQKRTDRYRITKIQMVAMAQTQAAQFPLNYRSEATTTKMELSKNFNFMYSFRPIYYFSRAYGFLPFTIIYNSRGTIHGIEVQTFDILWFGISIIMNSILAFMISIDTELLQDSKGGSIILVGGDYLAHIFSMVFLVLSIGTDMCIRYKLVDILKKINKFDEKVSPFSRHSYLNTN